MHRTLRFLLLTLLLVLSANLVTLGQDKGQRPASLAASPWEFIGPTNIQGRILCVAVNPHNSNTIYAGTAGSGIWRSRTAGRGGDWQRLTLGMPVTSVSSIAIDVSDTNTIYIGTGEVYLYQAAVAPSLDRPTQGGFGYGILKTTNGGASWSHSLPWTPSLKRGVQVIQFNPENHNTLFAGTTEGLYRSLDAGISWSLVLPVLMVQDIVVNRSDTTLVMASCGVLRSPELGAYLSLDGGEGWFRLDGFPGYTGKARLESTGADGSIVFASVADDTGRHATIFRTTDFGSTWDSVYHEQMFFNGWYSHFVAVHAEMENLMVFGAQQIYVSTNGGATMTEVGGTHNVHLNYAHDPQLPDRLYVTTEGGLYVSNDFGFSYDDISNGLVTAQIHSGFSNSETDPNFAVGQSVGGQGITYTGSLNWTPGTGDDAGWTAISPTNDSVIFRGMFYGINVVRSTNRGASYNAGSLLGGGGGGGGFFEFEPAAWDAPLLISHSNPNVLYLGRNHILKTTNAADSWGGGGGTLDGNIALSMAMSWTSPDTVYVGMAPLATTAHVFRTTNGGIAWQNVTGTLPNRFPLDLAVDPQNSAVVYASFDGYETGHLFKTTNAGTLWTDISGSLPDAPISAVIVDPLGSNMVYAGGDAGIFVSTDGGTTWSSFADALPEGFLVSDLTISPANRKLRMTTRGSGVYQHDLFSPATAAMSVDLHGSWNLISLPINAINTTPAALFGAVIPGSVYSYDGQYVATSNLEPGKGYWGKFPSGTTSQPLSGPALPTASVTLKKGWNLIGSVDHEIPAPSGGILSSGCYEYTTGGYVLSATLKPGHGYWVKASEPGTITLGAE